MSSIPGYPTPSQDPNVNALNRDPDREPDEDDTHTLVLESSEVPGPLPPLPTRRPDEG